MTGKYDPFNEMPQIDLAARRAREQVRWAAPDLLAALKPFAECGEQISDDESPEEWAKFRLLVRHYRAAWKAVAKAEGREE